MIIKCIKYKCGYYFSSDIVTKCQLTDEYIENEKCVGINKIKPKIENIASKISKLIDEYSKLIKLEGYIKNNQ